MTDRFLVNYIHIYVCSCLFANWQEQCGSKYKSVSPILANNVKFSNSSVMTQLVCGSLEVTLRERCRVKLMVMWVIYYLAVDNPKYISSFS